MIFKFRLSLTNYAEPSAMDPDDAANPLLVSGFHQDVFVPATHPTLAKDLALDWFHCTYPIAFLDDFDLVCEPAPSSGHELLDAASLQTLTPLDPIPFS
jgi:hypothetical protein